jgi:hypothetical protein
MCLHTGARLVIPQDHGKEATPRFTFETQPVPEPPLYRDSIYAAPVPHIDSRTIAFEMQRAMMQLVNDVGETDVENDFDIVECLKSPLLAQLDPELKTYIKDFMTPEERADLKEAILDHQQWITEYSPISSACLTCNTAIYPIGLGNDITHYSLLPSFRYLT